MSSEPVALLLWSLVWQWFLPVAFVLLAATGLVLLRLGLRGCWIDDHPLCAACGFDLFGKPDGVTRCGECGADVSVPAAVRIGHRERRNRPLATGVALLVLATLIGGPVLLGKLGAIDWQAHKPVGWLHREAVSSSPVARDLALRELLARYGAGRLSQDQVDSLVESGLKWQADRTNVWQPAWGNLIEAERAAGRLSPQQTQRFYDNVASIQFDVRPVKRRGEPLSARFTFTGTRAGDTVVLQFDDALATYTVGGLPVVERAEFRNRKVFSIGTDPQGLSVSRFQNHLIDLSGVERALADGPVEVAVKIRFPVRARDGDPNAAVLGAFERTFQSRFDLLPEGQASVRVVNTPELEAKLLAALRPSVGQYVRVDGAGMSIDLSTQANTLPVGLAHKFFIRTADGREWPGGKYVAATGARSGVGAGGSDDFPLDIDEVSMILQPDITLAERSLGVTEMWGRDLTFERVKVVRHGPGMGRLKSTQKSR